MRLLFAALFLLCLLPLPAHADQQWLAVSDIHLNPFDRTPYPSWYHEDTNWPLFESALAQMRHAVPNPRVVFVTGDFLAHKWSDKVHAANASLTAQAAAIDTMARMERAFARTFPKAQFVIVLGNNDDPCGDYRTAPGSPYFVRLAQMWAPLVNRGGASPDFVRDFTFAGAYSASLPVRSVRAVAIDDVFWSFLYTPCSRTAADPSAAQMRFLKRSLDALSPGRRSIVVMHIPPGVDPTGTLLARRFLIVPFLRDRAMNALLEVFAQKRASIAFAIAGHVHRNDFRLPGGVPLLVTPALSPVYSNNPGFLRLQIAPDGTLRDYTQYSYDEEAQSWTASADLNRTFGVRQFTAQALSALHDRIAADPATRSAWADATVGGSPHRDAGPSTWRVFWCAQALFGQPYVRCAGAQNRVALLPVAAGLIIAAAAIGFIILVLRLARQREPV